MDVELNQYEIEDIVNQIELGDIQEDCADLRDKYYRAVLEIRAHESAIENLRAELNAIKEECENPQILAGKLYYDKEFADVKIVCIDKTFDCHKAVQC